jgi:ribokinase
VASAERLPTPGETITGARLARHPGGKGANQALAARRLGAEVHLLARVGRDAAADEALALLRAGGVDLAGCEVDAAAATGVALIAVAASGENQIIIAPGANAGLRSEALQLPAHDAVICQLEIPLETVSRAAALTTGFFCINLAPAMAVPQSLLDLADLVVVNDTEAAFYGDTLRGLVAVTHGARGATLLRHGRSIARATPPTVNAIDTTGSGDAFVAALTLAMIEGQAPQRALQFACAAGAAAATRAGAQPSLPSRDEVATLLHREQQ